ncbi:MAG: hypothetical protein MK207_13825 [Saprospiraceae bacterium]|nr:hypothetical protein [Saprospiraceae bacterium]
MKLENQTILITSNEPWGDLWYSKQNYAYELSKKNTVYFINPPTKWRLSNLFSNPITEGAYNENLHYINYENFLPLRSSFLNRLNNKLISKHLKNYFQKKGIEDTILWAFDPLRLYNHKLLGCKFGIYHCVDFYYFQYLGEHELCKNSDLLFATSQRFLDDYGDFSAPKYVVPHGISSEEFITSPEELNNMDIEIKDYALYAGVIDHRMDFSLLERAITKFPDVPFLFVGPLRLYSRPIKEKDLTAAKRIFEEKKYNNLHSIGSRHFKTLKNYIKNAKFCISFMDMEYHANTVHHHKTLVYLTQGKPVFGPVFSEYKDLGNIMYMHNDGEEQLNLIESFLNNGEAPELEQLRIDHAMHYTFENVLKNASKLVERHT